MLEIFKIWKHQGKQFIPDVTKVNLPSQYHGLLHISKEKIDEEALTEVCPTQAIQANPVRIDMGKCTFCGECTLAFPEKIKFTNQYKMATNDRSMLIIGEEHGEGNPIPLNPTKVRSEILKTFGKSLKLRQVSAAGENSAEMELGASENVNFDMGRYGIEFVASPRHADGIVITGPISENMAEALQICYDAVAFPKIVILVGVDAISGGVFAGSPALDRRFLDKFYIDLYVPGNPPHPLTFVNGILSLTRQKFSR